MTTKTPTTAAQLFDYVHQHFGIGADADEIAKTEDSEPFWKQRATGIGVLKRMMTKRNIDEADLALAVQYAAATRAPIKAYWQIFDLVAPAKLARARFRREERRALIRLSVQDCAAEAIEAGDNAFAERILRAPERDAKRLLEQWYGVLEGEDA